MEKRYFHKQGWIVWIQLSVSVVRQEDGQPMHFVSQIQDVSERKRTEAEVKDLNATLERHIAELEQTTHEMEMLSQLVDSLHACDTEQEAFAVIGRKIVPLFCNDAGAVSIRDAAHNIMRSVVVWGGFDGMHSFTGTDCWTLRRSQPYLADAEHPNVLCAHFDEDRNISTLCIPMMARGEVLGVLHLKQVAAGTIGLNKQRLAQTVADDLGLLLSNLRLRETLRMQSIRDPLTGLFNRRYMEESFLREHHRAERRSQHVGMLMFDIDHFKKVQRSLRASCRRPTVGQRRQVHSGPYSQRGYRLSLRWRGVCGNYVGNIDGDNAGTRGAHACGDQVARIIIS